LLTEYGINLNNIASELDLSHVNLLRALISNRETEEYEIIVKQKLTEEEEEKRYRKGN
jgi:hypothetical protein